MAEPDSRPEWVVRLKAESERWVKSGLISAEQRNAIVALYPVSKSGERDRTILLLTLLGSLLLGAGVILFVAANWPRLGAFAKLAIIVAGIVVAYGVAYYLTLIREDYPRLGSSLVLLGSLLYGAGVWLVAQVFHLSEHFPSGFLLWGAGLLPLVWTTGSVWVLYLSTIVLGVWTVAELNFSISYNPAFLPVALVLLHLARRMKSVLAEIAVVFELFVWFVANVIIHMPARMGQEPSIVARMLMAYGLLVLLLGLTRTRDERAYVGLGAGFTLAGFYLLTFRWGNTNLVLANVFAGSAFQVAGVALLLLGSGALALLALHRQERFWREALSVVFLVSATAVSIHLFGTVPRLVVANVLLFCGTIALILHGIRRRLQLVVNLGLLAFMVHVLTRYFDLFFSAMDRSLFFVLGGVLLLGGGWLLERNRRRWMESWGGAEDEG